ncbi:arylamine N-acetyltransferase [Micromonospora sp. HNM0581]|uniref:arylamine N-acetyltransferase family protein n=1 Tax=Micromonospora sp. HNM0581 TaxID=2716341 RepID=UPI00146D9D9F|nr:arylamine N-acetyltransferase [Micromonospora sp. HNM0581]NLU80938.1 arylamine N-acetyltransferase [Micromonospora sp. HNM0581]
MPDIGTFGSAYAQTGRLGTYLSRLGVDHPGTPSVDGLRQLHRAHVERVPYEVLDIQAGIATPVDPDGCAARVERGRGGYCVQLNSAFHHLLTGLGYQVTMHRAGVQAAPAAPPVSPDDPAPHLALSVWLDGQDWFVDVGLGDGLHEPLPWQAGTYRQGPFTFRLSPSAAGPPGWRFDRAPRGAIAGLDIATAPATTADFAAWHEFLSTSRESRLVRVVAVMRRDAGGSDVLQGCMLRRIGERTESEREITSMAQWYGVLTEKFGLRLDGLDEQQRNELWTRVRAAHDRWLASGRNRRTDA